MLTMRQRLLSNPMTNNYLLWVAFVWWVGYFSFPWQRHPNTLCRVNPFRRKLSVFSLLLIFTDTKILRPIYTLAYLKCIHYTSARNPFMRDQKSSRFSEARNQFTNPCMWLTWHTPASVSKNRYKRNGYNGKYHMCKNRRIFRANKRL